MCEHSSDLSAIKTAIVAMSKTHVEYSKSLQSSARSQEKIAITLGVFEEKFKTITMRGCEKGVSSLNNLHRRVDDEMRGMDEKVDAEVKDIGKRIDAVKDSNWWLKIISGLGVGVAAVITFLFSLKDN